jgi:small GTP-binding protein
MPAKKKLRPCGRALMLGCDGAGKTTLLYQLKLGEMVTTIPTIGFNVEEVDVDKRRSCTVWDVGGQPKIRPLWRHYLTQTTVLAFVVDAASASTFPDAGRELAKLVSEADLADTRFVIVANKQDLPAAKSCGELETALGLPGMFGEREYTMIATCATAGDYESLRSLLLTNVQAGGPIVNDPDDVVKSRTDALTPSQRHVWRLTTVVASELGAEMVPSVPAAVLRGTVVLPSDVVQLVASYLPLQELLPDDGWHAMPSVPRPAAWRVCHAFLHASLVAAAQQLAARIHEDESASTVESDQLAVYRSVVLLQPPTAYAAQWFTVVALMRHVLSLDDAQGTDNHAAQLRAPAPEERGKPLLLNVTLFSLIEAAIANGEGEFALDADFLQAAMPLVLKKDAFDQAFLAATMMPAIERMISTALAAVQMRATFAAHVRRTSGIDLSGDPEAILGFSTLALHPPLFEIAQHQASLAQVVTTGNFMKLHLDETEDQAAKGPGFASCVFDAACNLIRGRVAMPGRCQHVVFDLHRHSGHFVAAVLAAAAERPTPSDDGDGVFTGVRPMAIVVDVAEADGFKRFLQQPYIASFLEMLAASGRWDVNVTGATVTLSQSLQQQ